MRSPSYTHAMILRVLAILFLLLLVVPNANAQPGAQQNEPAMEQSFEDANQALLNNDFDTAISRFETIVSTTKNPELRSAAVALANLARRLRDSGAHITTGSDARRNVLASPDQESGRARLVINTTLAAFYSSFALVDILGVEDLTPITLTVAASTAAGLGISLYATRQSDIHPATASAYSTGLFAGVANGLLIAPTLGIDVDGEYGDGEVNQNYLLFGLATMVGGGATGYLLSKRYHPTEGQVTTTSMAGLSGFASAGLLLAILQPESIDGDNVAMILALGMDAGLAGGALLTRDLDWSASRANYVALSQFLGALGGFTMGAIISGEDGDEKVYAGLVLGGIWAGLAGGRYLTRGMRPDASLAKPQEFAVSLSPLLGENLQGVALGGRF